MGSYRRQTVDASNVLQRIHALASVATTPVFGSDKALVTLSNIKGGRNSQSLDGIFQHADVLNFRVNNIAGLEELIL